MPNELSKADISGFPSAYLRRVEASLRPLIEEGLTHSAGEYNVDDIIAYIEADEMQLWVAAEGTTLRGIAVTELMQFPRKMICQVVLAAGTLVDTWDHCLDLIERWAFEQGAEYTRAYGRPGWKPLAKKHGYDVQYYIYSKSLRTDHAHTH